jgi:peptidoglycan hydrolase-like protein with peptidoglycan-binding domain
MSWEPVPRYRYVFKRGMAGTDVWALQLNLRAAGVSITTDGSFGPATDAAVKAFQIKQKLVADGIAGIMTQRSLCLFLAQTPEKFSRLPKGLLQGLCENESGYAVAAYTGHPTDPSGFDIGPYQDAFPPRLRSEENYANAYNAKTMATEAGKTLRTQKDAFRKAPKVSTDKLAWQLATLNHNWPYAADNLAFRGSIYRDPAQDALPQQWIMIASGGRLRTPREWVDSYISRATVYVTSWPT